MEGSSEAYDRNQNSSDDDIVGMTFESREEAFDFYQSYGKARGFEVRHFTTRHDDKKNIIKQFFVCCKQGKRNSKIPETERKRAPKPSKKTGCHARIIVVLMPDGRWLITSAEYEHNHELCPVHLTPFLRGHRAIPDGDLAEAQAFKSVGLKTSQIYKMFHQQKGSMQNVGFTKKDLYNKLGEISRNEICDGDVNAVVGYFQGRADIDMGFYMKYTTDEENRLHNIFWADSTSRSDYCCFGDVIAFDTTYKNNAYGRPLMPIVGVNHHHQTVVFGIAVLANQTSDTFEWVLRTFLDAMHGKSPISVVTDGDLAMERALKTILPSSRHRLCSWHMSRNALKNTGNPKFAAAFTRCMNEDWTIEEFENHWDSICKFFKLASHPWVVMKDRTRELWAQAYLSGTFFARMRSTQRCESMNASLKIHLQSKKTYVEFVRAIEEGVGTIRYNEAQSDASSQHTVPYLSTALKELEGHASEIYTSKSFDLFHKELKLVSLFRLKEPVIELLATRIFYLMKYRHPDGVIYKVEYDRSSQSINCSCKRFESDGFPCGHILYVLTTEDMTRLPESIILNRWTKNAKSYVPTFVDIGVDPTLIKHRRFASLNACSNMLMYVAAETDEGFRRVKGDILRITAEERKKLNINDPLYGKKSKDGVRDPVRKKAKGKKVEKKKTFIRYCGHCGDEGHDVRTCPDLKLGIERVANRGKGVLEDVDSAYCPETYFSWEDPETETVAGDKIFRDHPNVNVNIKEEVVTSDASTEFEVQ